MPFQPGIVQNPEGRIPVSKGGSRNKKSLVAFDSLLAIFGDNMPRLREEMAKLEGEAFVREMRGFAEFIIPKQSRVVSMNFNSNEEREKQIFKIGEYEIEFS
jgi:hypothetical protein